MAWEIDDMIGRYLTQNLTLAMILVFLTVGILFNSLRMALLVMLCVSLTFADTLGFLHYWDAYLNINSAVFSVCTIGVGIDYPAHIALAFAVAKGNAGERASTSLIRIGMPVINGAMTTFLSLAILITASQESFVYFFKASPIGTHMTITYSP